MGEPQATLDNTDCKQVTPGLVYHPGDAVYFGIRRDPAASVHQWGVSWWPYFPTDRRNTRVPRRAGEVRLRERPLLDFI